MVHESQTIEDLNFVWTDKSDVNSSNHSPFWYYEEMYVWIDKYTYQETN